MFTCGLLFMATAGGVAGQSGRLWRPGERILVTAYHRLTAVTTDMRRVYAASAHGIEVYDHVARRWEPPIAFEDGFPAGEAPTALVYDRSADALWLGTALGSLYLYRIPIGRWESMGMVGAGPVLRIVPSTDVHGSGVYLAVPGGWYRLERGALIPEPVRPAELPPGLRGASGHPADRTGRRDPFFDAFRGTLTTDNRLRRWPITDVAPADQPSRYWVATDGGNLFLFDSRFMSIDHFTFGTLTRGVGVIVSDGGWLWFGGDGRGQRRGVTLADGALQDWRYFEASYDGAPAGRVHAILPTTPAVWFAATDGLFRFDRTTSRWRRFTESDGLPSAEATALAPARGGVWVGTARGLTWVGDEGTIAPGALFRARRVHRLVSSADTLWIAGDFGLWMLPGVGATDFGGTVERPPVEPVRAPLTDAQPALRGPVVDVRPAFGALFALTPSALYRFDGSRWQGPIRDAAGSLGRMHALAAAGGQLWVAGDRGLAQWDEALRQWTVYQAGRDLPEGPVSGVLPAGDHLWVATPAGAMRIPWRD